MIARLRSRIERHPVGRWTLNFVLIFLLAAGGFWQWGQATEAERALCVFRTDLERRMNDTWVYLYDVRTGKREPIPGISEAEIVRSVENQRATVRSLSQDLNC